MKFRIILILLTLLVIIISVNTCRNAGQYLLKKDDIPGADAMVVLMGSIADRSLQAADLFNTGMVDRVIIVEASLGGYQKLVDRGIKIVTNTEQMVNSIISLGIPRKSILVLPGYANSTQMEACIVRDYLQTCDSIDTIIVTSSSFHTRRASMIFKSALKDKEYPVCVLSYPSEFTEFDSKKWWRKREGIEIVLSEYIKIVAFHTFDRWSLCRN